MPHHDYPSTYGDLYVEYVVEFPYFIDDSKLDLWYEFFQNQS